MNLFVADPEWGWWIVGYFFLGGIAAGVYFVAAFLSLFRHEEDRPMIRTAHLLAFPLIVICGIVLIVDLNRPERFWHMLLQSETVYAALDAGWPWSGDGWQSMLQAPILKVWSPMSIGAWAVLLFGFFSFFSFLAARRPDGRLARIFTWSGFGKLFQMLGAAVGFFVASYTGVLLTASNQPIWVHSEWVGALFLTSAASTGIATLILLLMRERTRKIPTFEKLERLELWILALEFAVFAVFLASLQQGLFLMWQHWQGQLLIVGTLSLALVVPLVLHLVFRTRWRLPLAAISVLAGGFVLRFAVLDISPALIGDYQMPAPEQSELPLIHSWLGKFLVVSIAIMAVLTTSLLSRRIGMPHFPAILALAATYFLAMCLVVLYTFSVAEPHPVGHSPGWPSPSPENQRSRGESGASLFDSQSIEPRSKVIGKK